jgi:mRNA interferase MazF
MSKRGEIVIVRDRGRYTGKPRPALIVQSDAFPSTGSVVVCLITSDPVAAPMVRIPITDVGLEQESFIMVDKIIAIDRAQLGQSVGEAADATMLAVSRALAVFLAIG